MSTAPAPPPHRPDTDHAAAIEAGLDWLERTQAEEGCWKGDYGGPLFLLPLYAATTYIMDEQPDAETRSEIVRYLRGVQNDDGGWGLHIEGPSYVYTTVLNYVGLRLFGVEADDPDLKRARDWFLSHGGATHVPQWGKFTLAMLGLMPWRGVMPVPPELWIVPESAPFHPGRMWCHARMVYLPMGYLYGVRMTAERDLLLEQIRHEIVDKPPGAVDWEGHMMDVAETDENNPLTPVYRAANQILVAHEKAPVQPLRERALEFVLDQVRQEDENTDYICIGPINKLLNTLCWHHAKPDGPEVERHLERLPDYLWRADDGVKMQGYNNSQFWDTAFAAQAIDATGRHDRRRQLVESAFDYIDDNQVLQDEPQKEKYYRERSTGGWPFSNKAHGWPISDCTAEGLKTSILLEPYVDEPLDKWRLDEAVEQMLATQNPDGGWPSYEKKRGPDWIEVLNPTQVFEDIMVDYSYVECTSACVQALHTYAERYPRSADERIDEAIARGRDFILDDQRHDGSWYGSWGVCFTYGTWFGVWGLRAAGLPKGDPAIQRACDFLVDRQLDDGGWGELSEACRTKEYVSTDEGQAVMTSWALLTLMKAGRRDTEPVERGIEFLKDRQQDDGTWPDEHIAGVFNHTCAIHYDNYLKIFPTWALGVAEE